MSVGAAWPAILLAGLVCLVAGCDRSPPGGGPAMAKADPHLLLQQEMEKGTMDFARVTVVRLQHAGQRLEVASVAPSVVARATRAGDEAKTIFRINDRGDALVLFSRNLPAGSSYRTELPLAQLESKPQFAFPVVQPDASLKDETFVVEKIIHPPAS